MADQPDAADPQAAALAAFTAMMTNMTATLNGLNTTIAAFPAAAGGAGVAAAAAAGATPSVTTLFSASTAFDLNSRVGLNAKAQAELSLDNKWDGTVDMFPAFILDLKARASKCKWNDATSGILTFVIAGVTYQLLENFRSISVADLTAARTARTDARAIQNAEFMYNCLVNSITGNLRTQLMDRNATAPIAEDGPILFRKMIDYSPLSSMAVVQRALDDLNDVNPATFHFNLVEINKRLGHLFALAATPENPLGDPARCQHAIRVYKKIKQPSQWAFWVDSKSEAMYEGTLPTDTGGAACSLLMIAAESKKTRLEAEHGDGLKFRATTFEEDVVAMASDAARKVSAKKPTAAKAKGAAPAAKKKLPPFVRHARTGPGTDAPKYVEGATKTFEGTPYYFCGCPDHKNSIKWHTFKPSECKVLKAWKAKQQGDAHVADDEVYDVETPPEIDEDTDAAPAAADDAVALLSQAFEMAQDDAARNHIASALNALHGN